MGTRGKEWVLTVKKHEEIEKGEKKERRKEKDEKEHRMLKDLWRAKNVCMYLMCLKVWVLNGA